jgi:hypothetical protein
MRQYESAFLGLILAGVVMMVIGLGLIMGSGRSDNRTSIAQQFVDRTPGFAGGLHEGSPIRR